jgi:uncharacterized membrane protein
MLYVIAGEKKQLSLSVEFKSLGWLVYFMCSLEVLGGSLFELGVICVDNLVQVMYLTEVTTLSGTHHGLGHGELL